MYAINLCDLSELDRIVIDCILVPDFLTRNCSSVRVGKYIDDIGVIMSGPGADDPERLGAVIDILHGKLRPVLPQGRPVRVYKQGPRGAWKLLSAKETYS